MRPRTCIGRRIGARRPPDRALVDEYRATKILGATEFLRIVDFCGPESLIEARLQVAVQDFVQECRFARTGDSVTHTSLPSGTSTFTFCRLNLFAPRIFILPLSDVLRSVGSGIASSPRRYASVREPDLLVFAVSNSSSQPAATMVPPWTPAPGPISMM